MSYTLISEEDKEKLREKKRSWYRVNSEKIRIKRVAFYKENPEKVLEYKKTRQKSEWVRKAQRDRREKQRESKMALSLLALGEK